MEPLKGYMNNFNKRKNYNSKTKKASTGNFTSLKQVGFYLMLIIKSNSFYETSKKDESKKSTLL